MNSPSDNSGAYIFRPMDNLYFPLVYTDIVNCTVQHGQVHDVMTFYFGQTTDMLK